MHMIRINYRMLIFFEGDDAQSMQNVAMNFAKMILCNDNEQCKVKVSTFNHPDFCMSLVKKVL